MIAAHAGDELLELGLRRGKDALDLSLLFRGEIQLLQDVHEVPAGSVMSVPMSTGLRRRIARSCGMHCHSRKPGGCQRRDYDGTRAVHGSRWRVHQSLLKSS